MGKDPDLAPTTSAALLCKTASGYKSRKYTLRIFRMGMNKKRDETHRRAKELARITGESIAEAVDRAVTERLERLRRQQCRAQLWRLFLLRAGKGHRLAAAFQGGGFFKNGLCGGVAQHLNRAGFDPSGEIAWLHA